MSEVITNLTIKDVMKAITDVGLRGGMGNLKGTEIPCAIGTRDEMKFEVYIQENQSLCFQASILKSNEGLMDLANHWNAWQRFSKAIPVQEGYVMRFEADVSHGITRGNLMALARKFGEALTTFNVVQNNNKW